MHTENHTFFEKSIDMKKSQVQWYGSGQNHQSHMPALIFKTNL